MVHLEVRNYDINNFTVDGKIRYQGCEVTTYVVGMCDRRMYSKGEPFYYTCPVWYVSSMPYSYCIECLTSSLESMNAQLINGL